MKLFIIVIVLAYVLVGCAATLQKVDTAIAQNEVAIGERIDTVWAQKDCRAGIAQSLITTRPASLQAKTAANDLLKFADVNSVDYQKCFFFAANYNWELYALQDMKDQTLPQIMKLIGTVAP